MRPWGWPIRILVLVGCIGSAVIFFKADSIHIQWLRVFIRSIYVLVLLVGVLSVRYGSYQWLNIRASSLT